MVKESVCTRMARRSGVILLYTENEECEEETYNVGLQYNEATFAML